MKNYKFGVVILHYKTDQETINCAMSINKLNNSGNAIILIVDNASNDGSLEKVKEKLKSFQNIIYMQNDENIGFSKANNIAYKTLKKDYGVQFVVFLNNDIVIKQKNFFDQIINISKRDSYAILGPDIYTPTLNEHQNPIYKEIPDMSVLENEVQERKEELKNISHTELHYLKQNRNYKIKSKLPFFVLYIRAKLLHKKEFFYYEHAIENPVFCGACLILTPIYVLNFDSVFTPETKFYFEELILAQKCKTLKLKTLYTPELKVIHYHGVSTRKSTENIRQYILFTVNQHIESFMIYKEYCNSLNK